MKNKNMIFENTATLVNTNSEVGVQAEIDNFREGEKFDAFIATNKISMRWNGKTYVGNAHGMEFTSAGPKFLIKKDGR